MAAYRARYEKSHALVIGIDAYDALPPLQTAVHDAQAVAGALADQLGFEVALLCDARATRDAILTHLSETFAATGPDDRVLVYFAGHGLTRRTTTGDEVGLLAPYGVQPGRYHQAIEMDYLVDRSKFIPAKHILFVLDACFSGLAVTRGAASGERMLGDLMTRRAVQAVAAGQKDQEVSDLFGSGGHSIFTGLLLNRLEQRGGILTGNELGLFLQRQVGMHTRSRQTPHYGHLLGSQGGDFVFWAEETVVELPSELRQAMQSPMAGIREGAVRELAYLLESSVPELAARAREALQLLAEDDSKSVSAAALEALGRGRPAPRPVTPPPAPLAGAMVEQPAPTPRKEATPAPAKPTGEKIPFFRRWWRAGAAVLALLLPLLTGSVSAILAGAILLAIIGVSHLVRRRWARAAAFLMTAAIQVLFYLNLNLLL